MIIYLLNNPTIFDVLKVRVATVVIPSSPVNLHIGSEVTFKVVTHEVKAPDRINWSSNNMQVMQIDQH